MDNAHQRPFSLTELSKNNNLRNIIKNIFNVDLHHSPIMV
jgi:hypothetical protein